MSERSHASRSSAGLDRLNRLPRRQAESALLACCGSLEWARRVAARRPFRSAAELLAVSDAIWRSLRPADWLEAFAAHPRIGDPPAPAQPEAARAWSEAEQAGVRDADAEVQRQLREANAAYEAKFGHIFIIAAAGRSAPEMLAALRERLAGTSETELRAAAEEQRKIARARLEKLLGS